MNFGKGLIFLGILLIVLGVTLSFGAKLPWLGHLPGDIYIQRGRFTVYLPLTICILLSLIFTLVLYLFRR
jgi:uncharacterized membrane protein